MFPKALIDKAMFNWRELDGRKLVVVVCDTQDGTVVMGIDDVNAKTYVLHMEVKIESLNKI